jgi:ATP-dependent DNA ligase
VAGRPDFNLLQNFRDAASQIVYYVFDLLVYQNRDLTRLSLKERRELMFSALKLRSDQVFASEFFEVSAQIMLQSAREQGLEGIVGKRKDSAYGLSKRSGTWIKHRLNAGQEFVIGGYTPGPHGIDAILSATTAVKTLYMSPGREMASYQPLGGVSLRSTDRESNPGGIPLIFLTYPYRDRATQVRRRP